MKHKNFKFELYNLSCNVNRYFWLTLLLWIWNSFCLKCMFVKQIFRTAIVARNVEVDVDSLDYMFYKLDNITTISGLDSWDTRNVVDMKFLFGECKNLEVVSGIDIVLNCQAQCFGSGTTAWAGKQYYSFHYGWGNC